MATLPELTELLDSELQGIIATKYGIGTPSNHVGPSNSHDQQTLPSLQYETQVTPIKRGLDGEAYVDDIIYENGSATAIIFRKDYTLYFDVIASAGNDDTKERDELYTAVDQHFTQYVAWGDAEDLHSDADELRLLGTSDESRPDDAVRGDRFSVELDFSAYLEWTGFSSLESVQMDVEVGNAVETVDDTLVIEDELILDGGTTDFTYKN